MCMCEQIERDRQIFKQSGMKIYKNIQKIIVLLNENKGQIISVRFKLG